MSIFTETFQNFVFNQLKIREAALNQKSGRSLGAPKVEGLKGPNSEETNVTLPPGAFHTLTTSKQCIIRMSSGVDLKSENDLLDKSDIGKENLVGEGLAIRYMLEGGVPAKDVDFLNNRKEGKSEIKVIPRGRGTRQFAKGSGKDYGSAYGDPYIRSNAGDDFGIVPMPGIIDAQIRTKTAYGSLRDAQINFVCHNRRQLDILETLYMRPGMPVLLEWGWSTYINNKGIRENYFPYLWEWFNKNENLNNINKIIHDRVEKSSGNYDGFVGYVKNFEIVSRPDGGYDCTTELSAIGEMVEGLKGRKDGLKLNEDNGISNIEVDNLEYYLTALLQFCEEKDKFTNPKGNKTTFGQSSQTFAGTPVISSQKLSLKQFEKLTYGTDIVKNVIPLVNKEIELEVNEATLNKIETTLDEYLLYKNEKLGISGEEISGTKSSHHYVRWDLLCEILNHLVFNTYQTNTTTSEPIIQISYRKESPVGIDSNPYLEYSKFDFKQKEAEILTTQNVRKKIDISNLLDMSVYPEICLLPHQFQDFNPENKEKSTLNRNIGHIFIGLEYLVDRFKKLRYKGDEVIEDFNLLTYLQTIWEKDINNACGGTHNFLVSTEKTSGDTLRIIDITKGPEPNLTPTNLYNFKTHGLNSIVRDFNYNTTIDSKLSSTVAIAAQSPNSVSSLDAVSFAAFNRNIQSRFFKELNEGISDDVKTKKAEAYDEGIENIKTMLGYLYDYRIDMLKGDHEKNQITALRFVKNVESQIISLKSKYSETVGENYKGYLKKKTNISKSTIIPLKFNCQIDGIGGLIIGNVFKVDKTFLPKGYEQDDIAFAIMTENQTITAGQDWTTEFSGQVILLDLGGREKYEDIQLNIKEDISTTPLEYNPYSKDFIGATTLQNITDEQKIIDPEIANLDVGDLVYLKISEGYPRNMDAGAKIRTGAFVDNGVNNNNIGDFKGGNKGLELGTILNIVINNDETWYQIEFNQSSIINEYFRKEIFDGFSGNNNNVGWMRIDTLQASSEYNSTT